MFLWARFNPRMGHKLTQADLIKPTMQTYPKIERLIIIHKYYNYNCNSVKKANNKQDKEAIL